MTSAARARPVTTASLAPRFMGLWRRCLLPGMDDEAPAVWAGIEAQYAEPHRHYHDARHLDHCLRQFDLIAEQIGRPDQVEAAIWFHDVIVVPGRRDNEQRSADYFRDVAEGESSRPIDRRGRRAHPADDAPDDRQTRTISSSATSTCRASAAPGALSTTRLRSRPSSGPARGVCPPRAGVPRGAARRARIFLSDFFHDADEAKARDNIRRFLRGPGATAAPP